MIYDQGSFFVGGVPKITRYATSSTPGAYQQITVGQMYVGFQIPLNRKPGSWPVIMVHGSTHSGACVESTPQETEGWAPYFVQNGIATYVVDQPGRGRSGNDESRIHEGKALLTDSDPSNDAAGAAMIPNIGRITDNGSWTSWFGHLVVPGTATTSTDILTGELVPHGWRPDDPSPPTVHPNPAGYGPLWAFNATQDFIYPANVDYSNTGTWGPMPYGPAAAYKLHYYRQLLPNYEVTLPASQCPTCAPTTINSANTWTPRNLAALVERLGGAVVATHSQSGMMGNHMTRILKERGHLNMLKGLITIEGMCSFPNAGLTAADFDNVPYLTFFGDYTDPTNAIFVPCIDNVNAINARRAAGMGTAKAEYIALDSPSYGGRFNGTTHMMMLDTDNLKVADVLLQWSNQNIPNTRPASTP